MLTDDQFVALLAQLQTLHNDNVSLAAWLPPLYMALCAIVFFAILTALTRWRR